MRENFLMTFSRADSARQPPHLPCSLTENESIMHYWYNMTPDFAIRAMAVNAMSNFNICYRKSTPEIVLMENQKSFLADAVFLGYLTVRFYANVSKFIFRV